MSTFLCCCPQCYPCVTAGNSIKNKILYGRNNNDDDEELFMIEEENKFNKTSIVLRMQTDAFFNGLPLMYEEEFPQMINDSQTIDYDDFHFTIMNINHVIQKSIPCVGKIVLFALLVPVSCGLSAIPLWKAGTIAKDTLEQFLKQQNETVYDVKYGEGNVRWELKMNKNGSSSCIQVHINVEKIHDFRLQQKRYNE
jgi:hypothetical protein